MIDCMCSRCGNKKAVYTNSIALPGHVYTVSKDNPEEVTDNHVVCHSTTCLCSDCQSELNLWLIGRNARV